MVKPIRKLSHKNPPYFSHEFVIQNHADIVSCVVVVFIVALMVQSTSSLAANFVLLQHNVTEIGPGNHAIFYQPGYKDWYTVHFYTLIFVIFHAAVQEYLIDKISKKLHLSKSKLATFVSSAQYSVFYLLSVFCGCYIIFNENYFPYVYMLWIDYPEALSSSLKMYILFQMSYSLHEIPELYFQKVKKEDHWPRIRKSLLEIVFIAIPYYLNFNRLLLYMIVLHHVSELVANSGRVIQIIDKDERYTKQVKVATDTALVASRLITATLAILTLKFGCSFNQRASIDWSTGNFNVYSIRMVLLFAIGCLQVYLIMDFLSRFTKRKQRSGAAAAGAKDVARGANKENGIGAVAEGLGEPNGSTGTVIGRLPATTTATSNGYHANGYHKKRPETHADNKSIRNGRGWKRIK